MKTSMPYQFLAAWMSVVCYLPPIYLFTDAHLLPKWYLCLLGLAVTGMLVAVALWRGKRLELHGEAWSFVCKVFTLTTALECLWVVVCIVREGLRQGGEAGTLDNPAELSLHLCVVLPMTGWLVMHSKGRSWRLAYGTAAVLSAAVLWLTQSRTGLICLALYGIIGLWLVVRRYIHQKLLRWGIYGVTVVVLLAGTSAYVASRKTDSTSGRAFILSRSWELVKEHPIIGHGHRGFEREYMLRQADFFREHPDSEYAVLADEIRHPLNEFLYVWVNYGVAAPVALLLLLLLPLWRWLRGDRQMAPFLLPMTAILVFSCFSYPFYYPIAWLTVGVSVLHAVRRTLNCWQQRKVFPYLLLVLSLTVIAFTMNDAVHEHGWYRAYRHSFREDSALMEYEDLYPYFRRNHVFLYSYAMASFKRKDLDRAKVVIDECGPLWSGYNRELLAGDICYYMEEYPDAITHYEMAQAMCPVRFAPLEGLYKVYDAIGDENPRKKVADQIATKQIKVNSLDIMRIKMECK